jgi:hypothetical protein
LTQKLENVVWWLYVFSKTWSNIMILVISSFRNMSQNKRSISKFIENLFDIFLRWITWYWITWQCGKNVDLLQLIVFGHNNEDSYFSTYSEIRWTANVPLLHYYTKYNLSINSISISDGLTDWANDWMTDLLTDWIYDGWLVSPLLFCQG